MQNNNYTLDPVEEDDNHADGDEEHRLLDAFFKDLDRLERMSDHDTKANLQRLRQLKHGSEPWIDLRNAVVDAWTVYAVWVASRFGSQLDIADRIQIAGMALIKAVEDIDPDSITVGRTFVPLSPDDPHPHGGTFGTYAKKVIENALLQAVAKQTKPVALDYSSYHTIRKHLKPVSAATKRRFMAAWDLAPVWIDAPIENDDGSESEETKADYLEQSVYPAPDIGLDDRDLQRQAKAVMDAAKPPLTEDERTVIRLRFGLSDGIEHTIREIAQVMNLPLVRARSLRDSGLRKLKRGQGITAAEVGNLEKSALHKMQTGAGVGSGRKRFLVRASVKPATCHPERPALTRGKHRGKCSVCALRAFRRSQKPTCGHPDRKLAAQGKCSQCYRRQLTANEPRTCGHTEAPYGARGLCLSCWSKQRWQDGGRLRRQMARERRTKTNRR